MIYFRRRRVNNCHQLSEQIIIFNSLMRVFKCVCSPDAVIDTTTFNAIVSAVKECKKKSIENKLQLFQSNRYKMINRPTNIQWNKDEFILKNFNRLAIFRFKNIFCLHNNSLFIYSFSK